MLYFVGKWIQEKIIYYSTKIKKPQLKPSCVSVTIAPSLPKLKSEKPYAVYIWTTHMRYIGIITLIIHLSCLPINNNSPQHLQGCIALSG